MHSILIQNINSSELEKLVSKAVADAITAIKMEQLGSSKSLPAPDKLLTKKEAATYLKISLPTLTKYITHGYVKAHTVAGTRMRFKISDLDKALKGLRAR